MSAETLLSVGIDLGTTTTQLVFSRLTVRNEGSAFSVPNYTVAAREVLRRIAVDLAVDAIPRNAPETADLFERRAKAARELLKAIAKGDLSLGIPELAGSASGGMAYYAPPSDFQTELEKM